MLAELRRHGWRLAVLTNCDDDLFEITHRRFRQPFDLFVQACIARTGAFDERPTLVGIGDLTISTAATVEASEKLESIPDPKGVRELILAQRGNN